jgi:hypothetical protein
MMKKIYAVSFLIVAGFFTSVQAQLLQWNTFGNAGTETTEPSIFNDPNLSGVTNLTLGTITPAANGNRFGGSGWFDAGNTPAGNTLAEAVAGNDYIQFIVTPNAGFSFTPTSFVFVWDRSATGPANVALRSSADGFASNLGTVTGITAGAFATNTITISGLTALTTATTFRLYGYQATGTGGTGGFDETGASAINVTLNGTTAATASSVITVTPTSLSGFTAAPGVPSAEQTYTVGGTGLTNDIVIAPPSGFEISLTTGAGFVPFPGSITLTQTAGTVATTTIYVRMNSAVIGTNMGNITHTSAGSNNPTVALNGNVVPLIPIAYVWIGLNGDWQVPANWAPARLFPATNDSLLFTSASVNDIITNVPTQTVGYMGVSLLTGITLQAAVSGNTLTIGDLTGTDLFVQAGSSLNINTANALTLNLVTGAKASISGNMTFTAGAHKLTAADASGITFNNGAVFTAGTTFSGNAFGVSPTAANSVVFANGSTYRQISGGNPFFLPQPASVVVFQTGSLFKLETNLTPSVSGRTYANFELDAPSSVLTASGVSVLNMDNLTVTNGNISFGMTTAGFNLKGNVSVATGATLNFAPASAGNLTFNGTAAQSISNAGTLTFGANQNVIMNNAAGLTLNTPVTLLNSLTLTSGVINTTATNLLTLGAAASVTGASNSSYVFGPVKKIGNTNFAFPVGKANGYVPIRVSNFTGLSAPTDEFTAEYIRASGSALGPITAPFINRVSGCEYWNLNLNNGTPTVDLTLYWNANNPCNGTYISNTADLEIAHFNNTSWNTSSVGFSSLGGGSTNASGDITWAGVSVFSPFTLASRTAANPLPITINYFNGTRSNGNHLLNWKVTCVSTPSATIEMERSTDGRSYSSIYNIFATAVQCQQPFNYTDNQPVKGINYYRLKMTDATGKITYSTVVTLINAVKGIDLMNIAPNPIVNGAFNLKVSTAEKIQIELVITDMQGRILQKQSVPMIAGFNLIPMNVRNLAAGTYQLFGNTTDGRTRILRFVIQ